MAEPEQGRTEQPTPFKLREARRRGTVAKSADVLTLTAVFGFAAVVALSGPGLFERQAALARGILSRAGEIDLTGPGVVDWIGRLAYAGLEPFFPLFILLVAGGVVASMAQTGPVFSAQPLKPDFERINPAAGLKRLFSTRMLVEALKSLLKLALLGWLGYLAIKAFAIGHLGVGQADPHSYAKIVVDAGITLVAYFLPALALVAFADFLYTRREYVERMKMSRRELREELKQREGDPRIRARVRELRREMLKRGRSLRRVKDADVLITNPTHLAVALAYRRGEMNAPSVVAKGAGELAARMASLARRHGVPVVRNAPLARGLFRATGVDEPIEPEHFADVARILAWVLARRGRPVEA